MEKAIDMVKEFHKKFGHPVGECMEMLSSERVKKRANWILEEISEFSEAENLTDQIDAIIDIFYFAFGTLVEMGVYKPELFFEAVHSANMEKLGPDGKPIYKSDGKIGKPEGWVGPEERIDGIIKKIRIEKIKK